MDENLPVWMPLRATCHPGCAWLDLAVGLHDLGYAPVPLGEDKVPLVKWAAYHVARPGWRELYNDWRELWPKAQGVGLICGRPHSLVAVDADDEASASWCIEHLAPVRMTKTARGAHFHFRHAARGVIGNRSGDRAIHPAPGVKLDVRGLGGMVVAPYSIHPSGHVYLPQGDWTSPVSELPVLPDSIRIPSEDHPPIAVRPRRAAEGAQPERALECYLKKAGGIPPERQGSDAAVFRAASWCKANTPGLSEQAFVDAIRRERPEFDERWVHLKWRSARGAA
jgi:hypothetical protein